MNDAYILVTPLEAMTVVTLNHITQKLTRSAKGTCIQTPLIA